MPDAMTWRFLRPQYFYDANAEWRRDADAVGLDARDADGAAAHAGLALAALAKGDGPLSEKAPAAGVRFVLPVPPGLDAMLAGEILLRRAAGAEPPRGLERFAEYAALSTANPVPGEGDPARSPGGLFLGILQDLPGPLDDLANTRVFLARWRALADAMWRAAAAGVDPFETPLPDADAALADTVRRLEDDLALFRADLASARESRPGPGGGAGTWLFLSEPASRLFQAWVFTPTRELGGGGRAVAAVRWGAGDWSFFANPLLRTRLPELAAVLNAAETRDGGRWFFADRRNWCLSSPVEGTGLSEARVAGLASEWGRVTPPGGTGAPSGKMRWRAAAALLLAVAAAAGLYAAGKGGGPDAPDPASAGSRSSGIVVLDETPSSGAAAIEHELLPARNWLLVIAINRYRHENFWRPLGREDSGPGPVNDAERLIALLRGRYRGYDGDEAGESRVVRLYNADATRDNIIRQLRVLKEAMSPADDLLIFFAGHGQIESVDPLTPLDRPRRVGFWIPYDGGGRADQEHWYSYKELVDVHLDALPARHILVIADSCYSGELLNSFRSEDGPPGLDAPHIRQGLGRFSRQVLASGNDRVPNDSEFHNALLRALDANQRDYLSVPGLYAAMLEKNMHRTSPLFGDFQIQAHQPGGQFYFILKDAETGTERP